MIFNRKKDRKTERKKEKTKYRQTERTNERKKSKAKKTRKKERMKERERERKYVPSKDFRFQTSLSLFRQLCKHISLERAWSALSSDIILVHIAVGSDFCTVNETVKCWFQTGTLCSDTQYYATPRCTSSHPCRHYISQNNSFLPVSMWTILPNRTLHNQRRRCQHNSQT